MGNVQERAWQAVVGILTERIRSGPRGELSAVAEELGVTRGTVSRWLSGGLKGQRVPYDKMRHIMRILGMDWAGYFDNPAPPFAGEEEEEGQDYCRIPWLEARASMGGGSLEVSTKVRSHLSFRRDWLLSKGNVRNMVVLSVEGDSMSPTIPDGSVVLINENRGIPPVNNKIYLVCCREELFLKRLKVQNGQVVALVSDLDGSEISLKENEYFAIIGRAIWYGKDI